MNQPPGDMSVLPAGLIASTPRDNTQRQEEHPLGVSALGHTVGKRFATENENKRFLLDKFR